MALTYDSLVDLHPKKLTGIAIKKTQGEISTPLSGCSGKAKSAGNRYANPDAYL